MQNIEFLQLSVTDLNKYLSKDELEVGSSGMHGPVRDDSSETEFPRKQECLRNCQPVTMKD